MKPSILILEFGGLSLLRPAAQYFEGFRPPHRKFQVLCEYLLGPA